jgi:hypothetical protein
MRYPHYKYTRLEVLERWAPTNLTGAGHLVAALEHLILAGADAGAIVARSADGRRQAFLVPPRGILPNVPEVCALVIVDHDNRTIALEKIFDGSDADPEDLWQRARRMAEALLQL